MFWFIKLFAHFVTIYWTGKLSIIEPTVFGMPDYRFYENCQSDFGTGKHCSMPRYIQLDYGKLVKSLSLAYSNIETIWFVACFNKLFFRFKDPKQDQPLEPSYIKYFFNELHLLIYLQYFTCFIWSCLWNCRRSSCKNFYK